MEYELLKQFDELLSKYYQLLQEPNAKNIDAIIKSIEKEKIHMKKSMQDFKKRDDKVNALLLKDNTKIEVPICKGFFVNKLGKLVYEIWYKH